MPEEVKKRHNMTFRMRTELRAAIEEIARSYGRSLSEQIEYYVETSVDLEAKRLYKYSNEKLSDTLLNFNKKNRKFPKNDISQLELNYSSVSKRLKETSHRSDVKLPFVMAQDPTNQAGALDMARKILAATRKGTIEALSEMLGPENVQLLLAEETVSEAATRVMSENEQLGATLTETLKRISALSPLLVGGSVAEADDAVENFSLLALTALLSRLTDRSPDLGPIAAASWPLKFMSLPPETRALLIGALRADAPLVYEDLVRPERSRSFGEPLIRPDIADAARGIRLAALRRMQHVLLPRSEDEDEGDFGGLEDDGIDDEAPVWGRA
ncbi:hypothetical protein [Methylobacterium sp. 88A]|uniref:hypothetical protein n=1 Tax=Methylobacterium sp. 88A TaxID=1131813 RepID=UPI0012F69813|nr:hypothetical protein [Methylobacterium sp. 88A]